MSLPGVKFAPLEMEADVGELSSEPEQHIDDGRDDSRGEYYDDEYGRDDGGGEGGGGEYSYDDDHYPYDYGDDDHGIDHRDAVPLVGVGSSSVETLVDPERRAICWPVYLVVALCTILLTAAVVLVPPADVDESNLSTAPSTSPSASPSGA
jgi:hypothetical protein